MDKFTDLTQNPNYNNTLRKWAEEGEESSPECEVCGCSLADADVIEGFLGWYCSEECCDDMDDRNVDDSDGRADSLKPVYGEL